MRHTKTQTKHMEGAPRRSLGSQAQHTYSLEDHTWSLQQSTSTQTKQQNSNYTQTQCELFHHTIHKHCHTRNTQNIQGYNITFTTSQVQKSIQQSKNNNSQCPDKLYIRHLKHIGPLGLAFLTSMIKTALNKNIIPHTDNGTSYKPISLLSEIADTGEELSSLHNSKHTHATRVQYTTLLQ